MCDGVFSSCFPGVKISGCFSGTKISGFIGSGWGCGIVLSGADIGSLGLSFKEVSFLFSSGLISGIGLITGFAKFVSSGLASGVCRGGVFFLFFRS